MDTHTAVAYASLKKYKAETGDNTINVIVSTASPYKFAKDVCTAIDENNKTLDPFDALDVLSKLQSSPVPEVIKDINKREVLHKSVVERTALKEFVCDCLK
jgi:threonine synthase